MLIIPARLVTAGRHLPGGSSGSPSEMPGRKQLGEELSTGRVTETATSSDLISEVSSLADLDI